MRRGLTFPHITGVPIPALPPPPCGRALALQVPPPSAWSPLGLEGGAAVVAEGDEEGGEGGMPQAPRRVGRRAIAAQHGIEQAVALPEHLAPDTRPLPMHKERGLAHTNGLPASDGQG